MITKAFPALGTVNTIAAECDNEKALAEIREYVLYLHEKLNIFDESSELSAVNRSAGETVRICGEARAIIEKANEISGLTDGAFDISALPLIRLWKNAVSYPTDEEISAAKRLVGYRNVTLSDDGITLKKGMCIDLGGIAKGYAADAAKNILQSNNIKNAVINFGGTVIVLGEEKTVGIQNPFARTGKAMGTVRVKNKAVVTSGSYEQFLTLDGEKVHHIIDPRNGRPSNSGIVGVTLIGDNAAELDALATGIFVLGAQKGLEIMKDRNIGGIFIDENGSVYATKELKDNFRVLEQCPITRLSPDLAALAVSFARAERSILK